MRVGIPSNVEFVVEAAPNLIGGGWRLHDRWYGGRNYGNGGLTVWHDDVRGSVSKRLQAAAEAAGGEL